MNRRRWLIIAILPALLLRVWLAIYPERLWYDEAFSVLVARLPWSRLIAATAGDVHPPLYYILLRGWLAIWGAALSPEITARLFSVLVSSLALWAFGELLKLMELPQGQRDTALLLAAYMPGLIFHAAEARMYSLLSLLTVCAVYTLWRAYQVRAHLYRYLAWLGLGGLCLGLAALTHNIGMLYAAVIAVAWLAAFPWEKHPPYWASLLIVAGVAIALVAPWVDALLSQTTAVQAGYWTWLPNLSSVAYALLRAIVPAGPVAWPWEQLAFVLLGGLTTWAALVSKAPRLILALGVPVLTFATSHALGTGLLLHRVLIPALPFIALLWSELLARPDVGKPLGALLAVALIAVNVGYAVTGRHAETWHELDLLDPHQGDVICSIGAVAVPLALYGPDVPVYVLPAEGKPPGTGLSAQTLDALGVTQAPLQAVAWERAWLFYYDALPGISQDDIDYFTHLRERYPGREIAPYSESLGEQAIIKGGLWLLQRQPTLTSSR